MENLIESVAEGLYGKIYPCCFQKKYRTGLSEKAAYKDLQGFSNLLTMVRTVEVDLK